MATESPAPEVALAAPSARSGSGAATVAEWEKAAAAVLRKSGKLADDAPDSDVWARLTKQTLDGIGIVPLGTPGLSAGLADPGLPGQAPFTRGTAAARELQAWDVRSHFIDPDARLTTEHIMTDLENGVNSLWLSIGTGAIAIEALPGLLDKVFLGLAPVVLEAPYEPVEAAEAFADIIKQTDIDVHPNANLGADPIGSAFRGYGETSTDVIKPIADIATALRSRAIVVDGTAVHDAGASDVQELAYTLAAGAAYLRILAAAGYPVDEAADLLEFRYAATDEQFTTIAKFRAARRLWNRVAELSGVGVNSRAQLQHAVTSRPMMSKYDPYVNMLRTTLAAFAAGIGGATSVTVLPFDAALGLPDTFSRRIARNTSSLLIEEAHVSKVTDPAGGAHAVEKLTDDLARAAWEAFGGIESAGGITAVVADGTLAAQVAETVERRAKDIATRKRPLTGVTEFPNLHEALPSRRPYPDGFPDVVRYGADFEALRDDRAATPVFVATMGPVAAHTARATFAANLFAAGGIDTVTAGATASVDEVVAGYEAASTEGQGKLPVVCLTGNDGAYAEWGAELVAALRAAGARWVVLAGRLPAKGADPGVDQTVAVGADVLEFLHTTREKLAGEPVRATRGNA
ncbi:MAG: methylmalonyl-CoA mutase family protein [Aeromicrobium sp.]